VPIKIIIAKPDRPIKDKRIRRFLIFEIMILI